MMWRIAIMGIVACALLSPVHSVSAAFPDVSAAHESRRAIEYVQREKIFQGYADGFFRPAFPINRAELLKVLIAAKGIEPDVATHARCFPDVHDQWYAPYVCYAHSQGWVQGYPDGTFGPERPVQFVEALKMLMNVRGYPPAPTDEVVKRGLSPGVWFAPYVTTALLIDVVSYEQIWGPKAQPLHAQLSRGFIAQLLYRSFLAEGLVTIPLDRTSCAKLPTTLELTTYVDVVTTSKINVFRQELKGLDDTGGSCMLSTDLNVFARVTPALDPYFLRPFIIRSSANSWKVTLPLHEGKVVVRGGTVNGVFRSEVLLVDVFAGVVRQLPSIFTSKSGGIVSAHGRYAAYIGVGGRTLEALDLYTGKSVVLATAESPQTFFSSLKGGQDLSFSPDLGTTVRYVTYDETRPAGSGYAVVETTTIDIATVFGEPVIDVPLPNNVPNPDTPIIPNDDPLFLNDPLFPDML